MISAATVLLSASENSRKEDCATFMKGYTDAGASDEMKNAYSECVVKSSPVETYPQPTIEAKMFVLVILVGWVISMIISTIKLKDGIFVGILAGTVFYTAVLTISSVIGASLLFILS